MESNSVTLKSTLELHAWKGTTRPEIRDARNALGKEGGGGWVVGWGVVGRLVGRLLGWLVAPTPSRLIVGG